MSMRAPRSTLDQVKAKLAAGKRKEPEVDEAALLKARLEKAEEEALAEKQRQKEEKKSRKEGEGSTGASAGAGANGDAKSSASASPPAPVAAALPPQVKLAPKVDVVAEPLPTDAFAGMGLPMGFGTSKKSK